MNSQPRRIAIFGGASAIASAWAEFEAAEGARFCLVGRDASRLGVVAAHLRTKYGVMVEVCLLDLLTVENQRRAVEEAFALLGGAVDIALLAHGVLGDQTVSVRDIEESRGILEANFLSHVGLLTELAPRMRQQGKGQIVVLSSVAGDRGRASNYVYGSAKAGLSAYLSGLRAALTGSGVEVLTVKPGMVDTPMTAGLKKGLLFSSPARVARVMARGIRKNRPVIYAPGWWGLIMLVIVHLPESIFRRLRF